MSVKVSGAVWDSELDRATKYVLLALADHAKHDGTDVYPSIGLVSWMTGYDERQVRRIVRQLEAEGILKREDGDDGKGGRSKTTHYRIILGMLPERDPYDPQKGGKKTAFTDASDGGNPDISSTQNPDIPDTKADILSENPDIAMSAEPLEPLVEPSGKNHSADAGETVVSQIAHTNPSDSAPATKATSDGGAIHETGAPTEIARARPTNRKQPTEPKCDPYGCYVAMATALERDPDTLPMAQRKPQLAVLKRMELTPTQIHDLALWARSIYTRVHIDAFRLEKIAGEWIEKGCPGPVEHQSVIRQAGVSYTRNRGERVSMRGISPAL